MKTSTAFLAAVLLATVIVNAAALPLREPANGDMLSKSNKGDDKMLSRSPLGRKMVPEEGTNLDTPRKAGLIGDDHIHTDVDTLKRIGLIGGEIRQAEIETEVACMTKEQCNKRKLVCSKRCTDSAGNVIDETKSSAAKCTLKCKKCVPNC